MIVDVEMLEFVCCDKRVMITCIDVADALFGYFGNAPDPSRHMRSLPMAQDHFHESMMLAIIRDDHHWLDAR